MLLVILLTTLFRPIFIFYSFLSGDNALFAPSKRKDLATDRLMKERKHPVRDFLRKIEQVRNPSS